MTVPLLPPVSFDARIDFCCRRFAMPGRLEADDIRQEILLAWVKLSRSDKPEQDIYNIFHKAAWDTAAQCRLFLLAEKRNPAKAVLSLFGPKLLDEQDDGARGEVSLSVPRSHNPELSVQFMELWPKYVRYIADHYTWRESVLLEHLADPKPEYEDFAQELHDLRGKKLPGGSCGNGCHRKFLGLNKYFYKKAMTNLRTAAKEIFSLD